MVQFTDVEGKCIVTEVPLAAFTDVKSGHVDITAVSKTGTFVRRGATQNGFPKVRAAYNKVNEGASPMRIFMASVHLKLYCSSPTKEVVGTIEMGQGDVVITAVGSSSYSLASKLFFSPAGGEKVPLGVGQLTYVRIDAETRRPTPLDPEHRAAIEGYMNEARNVEEGLVKNDRLVPPVAIQQALAPGGPGIAKVLVSSVQTTIRNSDTDFNGHTNQNTYITLGVDAMRNYLESARVLKSKETGVLPHPGNQTDISEVRIDYLNEVRDVGTKIQVSLLHESGSIPEGQVDTRKQFWFIVTFVPEGATEPKMATMGYMVLQ